MAKPVVLVVDDDDSTRRYLCACSRRSVTRWRTSNRARSPSAACRRAPPAVVLLDLLLPGMSGLEVLDKTRERYPEVPVIVLSTEAQIKTIVDAVRRGASDYLTKPFEDQELELALQNVLEKRELREEVRVLKRRLDHGEMELVSSNPRDAAHQGHRPAGRGHGRSRAHARRVRRRQGSPGPLHPRPVAPGAAARSSR